MMCVPACEKKIIQALSRRQFLKGAGALALAGVTPGLFKVQAQTIPPISASRVVDLTHTLTENFPTFSGEPQLRLEVLGSIESAGYNFNAWHIEEHTGTHMDAPFHFSMMDSADAIPVANLVGPLAVIDIRARAAENPDAELTPDDILAWEGANGELPSGAIVAMNSGWSQKVGSAEFRNADSDGVMHFPGFNPESAAMLLEREVKGIMVDTLSLDYGMSADFAVHFSWLPANRWGIECVANLGDLPASGATVIVGSPKVAGATGGPSRIIALV
jgi:kynurenine formamidase